MSGGFYRFVFSISSINFSAGDFIKYHISRTFLLKFWAKNRGCGLYTRQLLSEGVKGLVGVTN